MFPRFARSCLLFRVEKVASMTLLESLDDRKEKARRYQQAWRDKNRDKERARCRKWRAANKDSENARCRKWFEDHPTYKADIRLRSRYGITLAQKEAMLLEQGGCCAICSSANPKSGTGWHLDHCHGSNKVRGVLCAPCNILLGGAKDNVATLANAISYLTRSRT